MTNPVINIQIHIMRIKMNEDKCAKARRKQIIIMALGITALALLIIVGIAGATQSTNVWFHKGSELMSSEKYNEAIKAYDKAIGINPNDSDVWYAKGIALNHLDKYEEAIKAYDKASKINQHNSSMDRYNNEATPNNLSKAYETITVYEKANEIDRSEERRVGKEC